jgi:hypothetical protein
MNPAPLALKTCSFRKGERIKVRGFQALGRAMRTLTPPSPLQRKRRNRAMDE